MTPLEVLFWLIIFPVVEWLGWDEFRRMRRERKARELAHKLMESL